MILPKHFLHSAKLIVAFCILIFSISTNAQDPTKEETIKFIQDTLPACIDVDRVETVNTRITATDKEGFGQSFDLDEMYEVDTEGYINFRCRQAACVSKLHKGKEVEKSHVAGFNCNRSSTNSLAKAVKYYVEKFGRKPLF